MVLLAFVNCALPGDRQFNGLNQATRWMQLFGLGMLVQRSSSVLAGFGAVLGLVVATLHWGLIPFGLRSAPTARNAPYEVTLYLLGPMLLVAFAVARNGFDPTTGVQWAHLFTYFLLYVALLVYHDRVMDAPTYPGVDVVLVGAIGLGVATAGFFALRALARADGFRAAIDHAFQAVADEFQ